MQVQQRLALLKGDVVGLREARTRSQGGHPPPQQQMLALRGNAVGLRRCIFRPLFLHVLTHRQEKKEEAVDGEPPTKRKRGRPPKAKAEAPTSTTSEPAPDAAEASTKRKRGRPPKKT